MLEYRENLKYQNKNCVYLQVRLYKYIWPPHLTHPTLAVIGFIEPWGAINPMAELQARWAVRVFNGELKLPSRLIMDKDIEEKIYQMSKRYVPSPRHTIQVDHVDYCNEIADEVGCRPNICEIDKCNLFNILNRFIFSEIFNQRF